MRLQSQQVEWFDTAHPLSMEIQPPGHDAGPDDTTIMGRLIYSTNGLLVVHSDVGHWVVPPTALLRLGPDIHYRIRKADPVQAHEIELGPEFSRQLPAESHLYRVTPLLRELLQSVVSVTARIDTVDSRSALLLDLLMEARVWADGASPQCLGLPSDARVAMICDYIRNNLDTPKTLQEWARELNNDPRTLHRLFVQEFGMSFVQWRQQARLMAALEWLAQGRAVMDVALDLGYQTQSAFAAMFRRKMGMTPSEWQEKRRALFCKL